jgi:hypothetical protein
MSRQLAQLPKVAAVVAMTFAALALMAGAAAAHPLGNFTVNQYSRLEVGRDTLRVRYIVDMAEIPAFQERQTMDGDGNTITAKQIPSRFDRITMLIDWVEKGISPPKSATATPIPAAVGIP